MHEQEVKTNGHDADTGDLPPVAPAVPTPQQQAALDLHSAAQRIEEIDGIIAALQRRRDELVEQRAGFRRAMQEGA